MTPCVRTAEAIRLLYQAGLGHEAAPLTRTLLHHNAALCWLRMEPNVALEAIFYDHEHSRYRLSQSVIMRDWDIQSELVRVKKPKGPRPAGALYLDSVEKLVERVGLPYHYVAFRVDSAFVHPSITGADVYLATAPPGGPVRVSLRADPDAGPSPMRTIACAAIQATLVLAELSRDETIAELAAEACERFGLDVELPPLETATGEN